MATARGKSRGVARKGDVSTVKVVVDTAKKKRFEALLGEMHSSKRDEASGFDAYWEAVDDILRSELYVAGGYATADAFVRAVVKIPLRSALRNVRIARHASPAEEAAFGTALLDAAIGFIEAKAGGPIDGPLPVAFDKLRIPIEDSQSTKTLPLAEATVEQVRSATRALLGDGKKATSRRSPTEQAIVTTLHASKALRGLTVSVRDGKVRLGPFALESLADVARALSSVKLPKAADTDASPSKSKAPAKRSTGAAPSGARRVGSASTSGGRARRAPVAPT